MTPLRAERHAKLSAALAAMRDDELQALVDAAPVHTGLGADHATIELASTPIFVKRVRLTDLERAHPGSTANLFELPTFYQYGAGSVGFGAWRELAAHILTTRWVLDGACESFPLLYHHRVLREPVRPVPPSIDSNVAFWNDSPAVRARLTALAEASASVTLFLEHVPHTVHGWLEAQHVLAPDFLDREPAFAWMRARGFVHFDAHFRNVMTDGARLYFADLGLASSTTFELSHDERAFLARHQTYDRHYAIAQWVKWSSERGLVPRPADAAIAMVVGEFHRQLREESRTAIYPDELSSAHGR